MTIKTEQVLHIDDIQWATTHKPIIDDAEKYRDDMEGGNGHSQYLNFEDEDFMEKYPALYGYIRDNIEYGQDSILVRSSW